jgi:hypothetical protein
MNDGGTDWFNSLVDYCGHSGNIRGSRTAASAICSILTDVQHRSENARC